MTLADWAAEQQEPALFPQRVRDLHDSGRVLEAHAVLKRLAGGERDRAKARLLNEALGVVELWIEPLGPNGYPRLGPGTQIVDAEKRGELWIVTTASIVGTGGKSWLCTGPHLQGCSGRVPLRSGAKSATRARLIAPVFVAILALFPIAGVIALVFGFTPVHVVNGNGVPVVVTVDGEETRVPPHSSREAGQVFVGDHLIESRYEDLALGAWPVTTEWGRKQIVVNPNGRAVIYRGQIWYSERADKIPPDDVYVGVEPLLVLDRVDYLFEEPPDEVMISQGRVEKRTVLYDLQNQPGWEDEAVWDIVDFGGDEEAIAFASRAARLEPELEWPVAFLLSWAPESGRSITQENVEANPGDLDANIAFQEAWGRNATEDWYRLWYSNSPTQLNALMLARALDFGDPEALRLLDVAEGMDTHHVALERSNRYADLGLYRDAFAEIESAMDAMTPAQRADQIRPWLTLVRLAESPVERARYEWISGDNEAWMLFFQRLGVAPGGRKADQPLSDEAEAFVQLARGDIAAARELIAYADDAARMADVVILANASDGVGPTAPEYISGTQWNDTFRYALMLRDGTGEIDDYAFEMLPCLRVVGRPEGSIPVMTEAIEALPQMSQRAYVWAAWGVHAQDAALRKHARDEARRYLLPDELPYWVE